MRRLILLSILGCVAIMPVLILPSLVAALVDSAALTEQLAGWTVAIGALGDALGPGAAAMLVKPGHYDGILMASMVTLVIVVTLLRTSLAVRYANA